ncbi:hypothetical protein Q1695_013336 [Nippostrongylus brasiliensis]|nr:hypothetical protein Q1695_013336 [Nippostrongylus brasiliensis]
MPEAILVVETGGNFYRRTGFSLRIHRRYEEDKVEEDKERDEYWLEKKKGGIKLDSKVETSKAGPCMWTGSACDLYTTRRATAE